MILTLPQASPPNALIRQHPIGAEPVAGGVHFRVWAPSCRMVDVMLEGSKHALEPEPGGYYSALIAIASAGSLCRFRLNGEPESEFADPASRFQPEGPFGPSEVISPDSFHWTDNAWHGLSLRGQVLYEMRSARSRRKERGRPPRRDSRTSPILVLPPWR